jgi:hypothetical protein
VSASSRATDFNKAGGDAGLLRFVPWFANSDAWRSLPLARKRLKPILRSTAPDRPGLADGGRSELA